MSNASGVRAGKAFVELYADKSKLTRTLKATAGELKEWGSAVSGMGAAIAAAGTAMTAPFLAAAKVFSDMGSDLTDAAARTGASVESLSTLGYAADQTGTSMESVETGIKKMSKAIVDASQGGKEATEAIGALGLSVDDLMKMKPEDAFRAIARQIGAIENPIQRSAAAMAIFGKSGTTLLPMLSAIDDLEARARELGIEMATTDADAADALGDAWGDLTAVLKTITFQIGAAVGPALTDMTLQAAETASSVIQWCKDNRELILTIAEVGAATIAAGAAVYSFGVAITTMGALVSSTITILTAATTAFTTISAIVAFIASPIGAVTVAVGALGVGLVALGGYFLATSDAGQEFVDGMGKGFDALKVDALATFDGILDSIAAGEIELAFEILTKALSIKWKTMAAAMKVAWEETTGSILDGIYAVHSALAFKVERKKGPSGIAGALAPLAAEQADLSILINKAKTKRTAVDKKRAEDAADRDAMKERIRNATRETPAAEAAAAISKDIPAELAAYLAANSDAIPSPKQMDTSVSGTFSASAAQGMGIGDRMKDLVSESKKHTGFLKTIAGHPGGIMITG